ncbi:MAG: putative metalloprotease CJM1_0395 family protein [Proteobacteria bacterium]|nr:putative metalloprotease CJM1_0395 family protein [Pseudomonadota bacterium]
MTSNVVALPGIGLGPHLPMRPPTPSADQVKPAAESRADHRHSTSQQKGAGHQAEGSKSTASRPHSPVNLNSLLAAQEQGRAQDAAPGGASAPADPAAAPAAGQAVQLSEGERKQVEELKKQDAEIHRHEQAHAAAGGQYAGPPQYGYATGPDGQRYANSGHVSIDVTPVAGDPKATIEKMTVVQRAANAPAEPSGADRSVAARAAAAKQTAQVELTKLKAQESAGPADEKSVEAEAAQDAARTPAGGPARDPVGAPAEGFVAGFTFDSEQPKDKDKPALSAARVSHAAAAAAYAAPLNAIAGASTI